MRAVGAAGRLADRSQNQLRPAASAPPAAEQRAMETAAAAITAPVTPSAPAAVVVVDALQKLVNLGLSMDEAREVMLLPPAKRVTMMLVLLGN